MSKFGSLAFCLVVAVMAIAAAQPAAAAPPNPVVITSCYENGIGLENTGFQERTLSPFNLVEDCPALRLTMNSPGVDGDRGADYMTLGPGLSEISGVFTGGPAADSGVTVTLRACSIDACGRAVSPQTDGSAVNFSLTTADGIPENAVTLLLESKCSQAICEAQSRDTLLSNLKLTITDTNPPPLQVSGPWGDDPSQPGDWTNTYASVYISSQDLETFTAKGTVTVDGVTTSSECLTLPDGSYPMFQCASSDPTFGGVVFPDGAQGTIPFSLEYEDAAGNPSSFSAAVRIDTIAPSAPENLSVGANANGLLGQTYFDVSWTNGDERLETEDVSGIVSADYEIRNEEGQFVQGGTMVGDGIDGFGAHVYVSGTYTLSVNLLDRAGNRSDTSTLIFSVDSHSPFKPIASQLPFVNADRADSDLVVDWIIPTFGFPEPVEDFCETRVAINKIPHYDPETGADVTVIPAPDHEFTITAEQLDLMSDGVHYVHLRGISCAGVAGATADVPLVIDREDPQLLPESEPSGWISSDTKIRLKSSDVDPDNAYAGVQILHYAIDGLWQPYVYGSIAEFKLTPGWHTIVYSAEDRVGNISDERSFGVGVDDKVPTAAFDAPNAADPALVSGSVLDEDSGVSDAWFEYRAPGSSNWARLPSSMSGDSPRKLTAYFPDDESMPPGEYALQIVARDRANNTSWTTKRVGGELATVKLPLRPRASLTLDLARSASALPNSSLTVPFGSKVNARGVLRDASGLPVAGAIVSLSETISGGPKREFGTATTGSDGSFSAEVISGPSRTIEARFAGDNLRGVASARATFNVRGKVKLNALPKTARAGRYIYLRGKVDPGRAALPRLGALVEIRYRTPGGWSSLHASGRTTSDGSFAIPMKLRRVRRGVRFVFRATVVADSGWPYADGHSVNRSVVFR